MNNWKTGLVAFVLGLVAALPANSGAISNLDDLEGVAKAGFFQLLPSCSWTFDAVENEQMITQYRISIAEQIAALSNLYPEALSAVNASDLGFFKKRARRAEIKRQGLAILSYLRPQIAGLVLKERTYSVEFIASVNELVKSMGDLGESLGDAMQTAETAFGPVLDLIGQFLGETLPSLSAEMPEATASAQLEFYGDSIRKVLEILETGTQSAFDRVSELQKLQREHRELTGGVLNLATAVALQWSETEQTRSLMSDYRNLLELTKAIKWIVTSPSSDQEDRAYANRLMNDLWSHTRNNPGLANVLRELEAILKTAD